MTEAVVALRADRLHGGGAHALVLHERVAQLADASDVRIVAAFVDDAAAAHDVVDDDDAARARQRDRVLEIGEVRRLVRVDEREVERRQALVAHLRERAERGSHADVDVREAGAGDVLSRDLGVLLRDLERDEPPALGQRAREPNRAVAAERPDLEDVPRAAGPRDEVEQLSLIRRDLNRGEPGLGARAIRLLERRVLVDDGQEVFIDLGPAFVRHRRLLFVGHVPWRLPQPAEAWLTCRARERESIGASGR